MCLPVWSIQQPLRNCFDQPDLEGSGHRLAAHQSIIIEIRPVDVEQSSGRPQHAKRIYKNGAADFVMTK